MSEVALAETSEPVVAVVTDDKPAGYDPVDPANATPEEVQARLDYMYRQIKDNKRKEKEWSKIDNERKAAIAELSSNMNVVVDHLAGKQIAEGESQFRSQMQTALDAGDTKAYVDAQDKLFDLKAQKLSQKNKPVPENETRKQAYAGETVTAEDSFTPQENTLMNSWMAEKDDTGKQLRPWAFEGNEDYEEAQAEAVAVFSNKRYSHLTIDQKLSEIDKRMGVSAPRGGQSVIGGRLTGKAKSGKVSLSADQERIAIRTKFGGPNAKSDADHIDAYRKQVDKVNAKKGAR